MTTLRTILYLLLFLPIGAQAQEGDVTPLDYGLERMHQDYYSDAVRSFAKVLEQYPDNYQANMGMGISLRETGHLDSALVFLDRAIKIQATPEGYFNRAALFYMLPDNTRGERDERTATRMQPPNAIMYQLHGFCRLLRKDYAASISLFDSAIALDKNAYKAYLNKASALGDLKRNEEAIEVLDQVLQLKPDYQNAWYNRAFANMLLGNIQQSLADCNKLLELDGNNVEGLLLRADLKDKAGDDVAAVDDCDQAIDLDSNNAKAYNMRALARFDAHAYNEIIADCNRAIALKPDYYDPYVQRGDAYDDLGDFDKAIADYKKAVSIDPTQLQAYRECAASFAHKKDLKQCLYYLEKGLEIDPENQYLLGHKFQTQRQLGDPKAALATLDLCISYYPESPAIYYLQKAYIYDSLHDNASACKFAFLSLKTGALEGYEYITTHSCPAYKDHPLVLAQPYMDQGRQQFAAGQYLDDIATLTKAIALLPDTASLYYNRGMAKRRINDFAGAIVDYNKAITLHPRFPDAIVSRGVAKINLNDLEGAMADFKLAIKVDSTYAIAYNNCATLISDTDIPGAIDYLSKAVHFNKKYASAYLTRGKLYLKIDKRQEACADLRKAEVLGSEEATIERIVDCK